ncbi:DUF6151 family protein [Parerythrobacter aurantius]|uniref:DUF6151 family protein n=1 Tax=Parerythrobacter aurantius TaxID=3127706 RepID=UPI003253EFFD
MIDTLRFACACGAVSGEIERADAVSGDHVVCCCSDCRDFARLFDKEDRLLEPHGGTPLYQSRCARVRIDTGKEQLACLHMTERATTRWYAACCGSPMFNSYKNGRIPYITTLLGNCDAGDVERLLGKPAGYLFLSEAKGDVSDLPAMSMGKLMRRFFKRMLADIITGDRRRCELFVSGTLQPIVQPRRLTLQERQALGRA